MFVLNNTKELKPGKSWKDDKGLQHPGNWASVWSDDVKASYGIKEVTMQSKPDGKFTCSSSFNVFKPNTC